MDVERDGRIVVGTAVTPRLLGDALLWALTDESVRVVDLTVDPDAAVDVVVTTDPARPVTAATVIVLPDPTGAGSGRARLRERGREERLLPADVASVRAAISALPRQRPPS